MAKNTLGQGVEDPKKSTLELEPLESDTRETSARITEVLETPKIDGITFLQKASYFPIVDPKTIEGNESAGQLIASIIEGSEEAQKAVDEAVGKYIETMNSSSSTALYKAFNKAINEIMSGVKDGLDQKVQKLMLGGDEMGVDNIILGEELSKKLAELYAYLDNIGNLSADELEEVNPDKGRKLGNLFRSLFGGNGLRNVTANIKSTVESDETRFAKLEQAKDKIGRIVERIQSYPQEVMEDINRYKTTSILLEALKKYLQIEVKKQIMENQNFDEDAKQTITQDIDRMVVETDNLIALLNNSINIYINLMKESTLLWREIDLNYLRANYTTLLSVYQNASTDVMKKGVGVAQRLLEIEKASNVSMMNGAAQVTTSITQLGENREKSLEFLNGQIQSFTKIIGESRTQRAQTTAKIGQEVKVLGQNVEKLGKVVIHSK